MCDSPHYYTPSTPYLHLSLLATFQAIKRDTSQRYSVLMFPTNYRGTTPRDALRNYVLHPKPPLDMSATTFDRSEPRPVEPSKKAVPSTPVEEVGPPEQAVTSKPVGSVNQPEQGASTPRTPNSKASKTGRSLTKTALDFWEGYLSDGYKLRRVQQP